MVAAAGATEPVTPAAATLDVAVTGVRSDRGLVRVEVCPAGAPFPDCGARGVHGSAPITGHAAHLRFADLPPGRYAVAAFQDEAMKGHLPTMLGIPTAGFGFSANPPLRPRAPRFEECAIAVADHANTTIALRYLF